MRRFSRPIILYNGLMNYLAPLITFALFAICFLVAVFLRLAIGKPIFYNDDKPVRAKPRKPKPRKMYFVADLKPIVEEREERYEESEYETPKRRFSR